MASSCMRFSVAASGSESVCILPLVVFDRFTFPVQMGATTVGLVVTLQSRVSVWRLCLFINDHDMQRKMLRSLNCTREKTVT